MPTKQEVSDQLERLALYRITLRSYLDRKAILGAAHMPPEVAHGIRDTRNNIRRIKDLLRHWNVTVEDHSDDEPRLEESDEAIELLFVTEGARLVSEGAQVLFSIWNNGSIPGKLFEFFTNEYVRMPSIFYAGGARHSLQLIQNSTTLWDGETYEVLPGESASFNLSYTIKTGPKDSYPWVVFGIVSRYHGPNGQTQELHSDCIYLLTHSFMEEDLDTNNADSSIAGSANIRISTGSYKASIRNIKLNRLGELNEPNMFRHNVYSNTLQALSDSDYFQREDIVNLIMSDYTVGMEKLRSEILKKGNKDDINTIKELWSKLLNLVNLERNSPLDRNNATQKDEILEQLRQISVKHCGMAFTHLCQPET